MASTIKTQKRGILSSLFDKITGGKEKAEKYSYIISVLGKTPKDVTNKDIKNLDTASSTFQEYQKKIQKDSEVAKKKRNIIKSRMKYGGGSSW